MNPRPPHPASRRGPYLRAGHFAVAVLALGLCAGASAQWAWKDDNGHTVYSDVPPPPGTAVDRILRQPVNPNPAPPAAQTFAFPGEAPMPAGNEKAPGAMAPPSGAPPAGAQEAPKPKTWADRDADFRKRREDVAKSEQKQAEEQAAEASHREQCDRARANLIALQQGTRMLRPDASGERHFLEPEEREAEISRAQAEIDRACGAQ